jgi:hypothetical protein
MTPGARDRLMRQHWWMHAGDAAVRFAWKVLWRWRR